MKYRSIKITRAGFLDDEQLNKVIPDGYKVIAIFYESPMVYLLCEKK